MIQLEFHSNPANYPIQAYQIAGHTLLSNRPVPYLDLYQLPSAIGVWNPQTHPDINTQPRVEIVYSGPGWLANRNRTFLVHNTPSGSYLKISGLGNYFVSKDGQNIIQLPPLAHIKISQMAEALIGPCLILGLAFQQTWCLHASAVWMQGKLVIFLGASGYGKSTLASFLDHSLENFSCRYVDDILPVGLSAGYLQAYLHYPQLKIEPERQPALIAPEVLPVSAVYILAPATDQNQAVVINPLSSSQAMLALIRFTVAARLFNRELLAWQMEFCSRAARNLPVRLLAYPHQLDMLPIIEDSIIADLEVIA